MAVEYTYTTLFDFKTPKSRSLIILLKIRLAWTLLYKQTTESF